MSQAFRMKALRCVMLSLRPVLAGGEFEVDAGTAAELLKSGSAVLLDPARDLVRLGRVVVGERNHAPAGLPGHLLTR